MPLPIDKPGGGNSDRPPRDLECSIDDLPDELLSYVFQLGVEAEEEGESDDDSESSGEDEWEDVDDDQDSDASGDEASDDEVSDDGSSVNSSDLSLNRDLLAAADPEVRHLLPFQVLVSHVCRRWRSVALDTHRFWTTLTFRTLPRLAQAKEYISRSNRLPLTIEIDCSKDDDLSGEDDLEDLSDLFEHEKTELSLEELDQILDLLEPAISHWGTFIFYTSSYKYVHVVMSRLQQLPAAPCLESFQVHLYEEWDDIIIPEDKKRYFPFHGKAPNLKKAVFWGIHIDWEHALPNFLRGLLDLELSYLTNDVRPTYAEFAEIIKNSPALRTLTLSLAGPQLAGGVAFDSDEAWGPVPLAIPSLTELVLQFHDPQYASALVEHLDLPNVTHLCLNFDEQDYSEFVHTLAKPAKTRDRSLLRQITHLKISGLPCDITSVEILLSELVSLTSLNLKIFGDEEEVIYDKLVDPWASRLRLGPAFSSTTLSPRVKIPKFFCPKLEEITTTGLNGKSVKALIIARRDAGVPLKRIHMAICEETLLRTDDELWIKDNVEELYFYDPSDSEVDDEHGPELFVG